MAFKEQVHNKCSVCARGGKAEADTDPAITQRREKQEKCEKYHKADNWNGVLF